MSNLVRPYLINKYLLTRCGRQDLTIHAWQTKMYSKNMSVLIVVINNFPFRLPRTGFHNSCVVDQDALSKYVSPNCSSLQVITSDIILSIYAQQSTKLAVIEFHIQLGHYLSTYICWPDLADRFRQFMHGRPRSTVNVNPTFSSFFNFYLVFVILLNSAWKLMKLVDHVLHAKYSQAIPSQ